MGERDESSRDGFRSNTQEVSGAALDMSRQRKISLTLDAVPLVLPGEKAFGEPDAVLAAGAPAASHEALDAWNRDRMQRSSFPPSAGSQTFPTLPPATPLGLGPDAPGHPEEEGDALALVARSSRPAPAPDLVSEMSERFALGDFTGSLRVAELLLGQDREHELAQHYARESREKLEGFYTSRLRAQGSVLELAVPESELRWLGLDSRLEQLLSRIDGTTQTERVLELSGMPRLEALRCLIELVDSRVVRFV